MRTGGLSDPARGYLSDCGLAGALMRLIRDTRAGPGGDPRALELILGIRSYPELGRFVLVGLGGVWTEVLDDVEIRALPLRQNESLEMLEELGATTAGRVPRTRPTRTRRAGAAVAAERLGSVDVKCPPRDGACRHRRGGSRRVGGRRRT
jgi:hypothetical protein